MSMDNYVSLNPNSRSVRTCIVCDKPILNRPNSDKCKHCGDLLEDAYRRGYCQRSNKFYKLKREIKRLKQKIEGLELVVGKRAK